jgi:glycosyltransferase involved in cell wall biosynthesis
LYRFANFTTVLTKFDVDYYKKHSANVVVMPNPCTFHAIVENDRTKDNSIVAVGNLDRYHHKGFDNLITIVAPILKKYPSWNLKIVGEGDTGMNYLQDLARKNNILGQIIFLGFRKDVQDIMKNAEIFILSSRFEGLPMVLLEAMSQGMACIAYDCKTGPSDIIVNGTNGLLIEDQNIVAMQESLDLLINNKKLRKELSDNALTSLDRFSMQTIITKWEELFAKIL